MGIKDQDKTIRVKPKCEIIAFMSFTLIIVYRFIPKFKHCLYVQDDVLIKSHENVGWGLEQHVFVFIIEFYFFQSFSSRLQALYLLLKMFYHITMIYMGNLQSGITYYTIIEEEEEEEEVKNSTSSGMHAYEIGCMRNIDNII